MACLPIQSLLRFCSLGVPFFMRERELVDARWILGSPTTPNFATGHSGIAERGWVVCSCSQSNFLHRCLKDRGLGAKALTIQRRFCLPPGIQLWLTFWSYQDRFCKYLSASGLALLSWSLSYQLLKCRKESWWWPFGLEHPLPGSLVTVGVQLNHPHNSTTVGGEGEGERACNWQPTTTSLLYNYYH